MWKGEKQRRKVDEGGGKYMRQEGGGKDRIQSDNRIRADDDELKAELIQQKIRAVKCTVYILCEEKGIIIGGSEVGRYGKLNCSALARALGLNGSTTSVTHKVEKIRGNNDTLAATIALSEEET